MLLPIGIIHIYLHFQKTCFTVAAKYNQSHHPEDDG